MNRGDAALNWYAYKVFFNRVFTVEAFLQEKGLESYLPCEQVYIMRGDEPHPHRRPLISSLIFFRSTSREARVMEMELKGRVMLYTDRTDSGNKPKAIPEREMEVFRLVTSSGEKGMEFADDSVATFRKGQHVRVTGGPYKGAEGYIRRIKGNRRLVVAIHGICAVLTSYVPSCFLEKID